MNIRTGTCIMRISVVLMALLALVSCSEDDPVPPFDVNFTNTSVGITTTAQIEITFSRAAGNSGSLAIEVATGNLSYGETADFVTDPPVENDQITIDFLPGDETINFEISTSSGLNIQQDETLTFKLIDSDDAFSVGQNTSVTVTFSENFIAPSGTLEIDGGGSTFPNQAFIDLSKLTQTTADKYSWDLGFLSNVGEHRVILNNSAYVMARALESTDIDAVTAQDTAGFAASMYISNYEDPGAANWIDHQSGDLDQTAIGLIGSSDEDNRVFIIKRDGEGRNWKKIRILRDGDNYAILHADIDATTHNRTTVTKDAAYQFNFLDLDHGMTTVSPETDKWDLMYSTYANRANFGITLAVGFNDFITVNRQGVSAVMVNEEEVTYEDFNSAHVNDLTFVEDNIAVIGSTWRSLVDFSLVLNEDRFYVIRDGQDQIYKLKFTRLTSIAGERGYPEITFERVQ
ncbi:MAG: HmuY family protein [Cytophagales bacterium]|nr:HmuY family protein [Cytophagales bacterium]